MIPKYAPADLGLPSSAPQSEMVKQDIFDHVLGMIFWGFWTKFVHRVVRQLFKKRGRNIHII